jgi:hypothetical protein
MDFHLGSLKLEELMEGMKEKFPTEEEDTREAPHEPLRSLDAGGGILSRRAADCREREREIFEREATVQGFKYPWTRAQSDIVWAHWTLSMMRGWFLIFREVDICQLVEISTLVKKAPNRRS